jgi:hypothetical protein
MVSRRHHPGSARSRLVARHDPVRHRRAEEEPAHDGSAERGSAGGGVESTTRGRSRGRRRSGMGVAETVAFVVALIVVVVLVALL